MDFELLQRKICQRYGAEFVPLDFNLKLGIADDFFSGQLPPNGLRHPPENGTCGWFLWAGEELSQDVSYFKPWHVFHLIEKYPEILQYPGLPAGWRFLVADNYEDVWFDEKLLEI
jgi:hypothetical protein